MTEALDKLGLGTAQFGFDHGVSNLRGRLSEAEAMAALTLASEAGLRLIDTSAAFGDAEKVIGRCAPLARPFRVVTQALPAAAGVAAAEARARTSLRNLGAPRAYALLAPRAEDLLGPHGPSYWAMMRKLKDEGLFDRIGVSLRAEDSPVAVARRFKPDIVQLPVSLLDQRLVARGDLDALASMGVEVQLCSIFMQGLMFLPRDGLPPALSAAGPSLSRIRRQIAEAGADPLQAALAFALQQPQAASVIVGVASAAELRAILAAALAPAPRLDWARLALDDHSAADADLWAAA